MHEINNGRIFMGQVPHDADLLDWFTEFVRKKNIQLGEITLVGAVKKATMAYYHQDSKQYEQIVLDRHLEILHGVGNISMKDGKPFVHLHVVFSDDKGQTFGGHLVSGSTIFACEAIVREFIGAQLDRKMEKTTGLTLWSTD